MKIGFRPRVTDFQTQAASPPMPQSDPCRTDHDLAALHVRRIVPVSRLRDSEKPSPPGWHTASDSYRDSFWYVMPTGCCLGRIFFDFLDEANHVVLPISRTGMCFVGDFVEYDCRNSFNVP